MPPISPRQRTSAKQSAAHTSIPIHNRNNRESLIPGSASFLPGAPLPVRPGMTSGSAGHGCSPGGLVSSSAHPGMSSGGAGSGSEGPTTDSSVTPSRRGPPMGTTRPGGSAATNMRHHGGLGLRIELPNSSGMRRSRGASHYAMHPHWRPASPCPTLGDTAAWPRMHCAYGWHR